MIYTFYSFKGGVGRSMALANVAEYLHARGLSVVMIDWDLEAPGLETYFATNDKDLRQLRAHVGLVDLLSDYVKAYPRFVSAKMRESAAPAQAGSARKERDPEIARLLREELEKTEIPELLRTPAQAEAFDSLPSFLAEICRKDAFGLERSVSNQLAPSPLGPFLQRVSPDGPGLYLFSAGARPDKDFAAYAERVQNFSWSQFYSAYQGREFIGWLREQLLELADVTLIDSRTGVTEVGGVCTRHIPDAVIAFCAPNLQNIDGVARVMDKINSEAVLQARENREIDVIVVPTRIDRSESDRLAEFSDNFARAIERPPFVPSLFGDVARPLWSLAVPYIPRYNYNEERVIGAGVASPTQASPVAQELIGAYQKIAVALAALAPVGSPINEKFAADIATMLQRSAETTLNLAPPPPKVWIVRSEREHSLLNAILEFSGENGRLAVWGPLGAGKTSLIAAVCRTPQLIAAFPQGIVWAPGDRLWTPDAARERLGRALAAPRGLSSEGLQSWLAGRRFLLVLDDVRQLADIEPLLTLAAATLVVIATRDRRCANTFSRRVVSVEDMEPPEANALLRVIDQPVELGGASALPSPISPLFLAHARSRADTLLAAGLAAKDVVAKLQQAFGRHGVLAFEPQGLDETQPTVANAIRSVLAALTPEERAYLVRIAKVGSPPKAPAEDEHAAHAREFERLVEFGLVRETPDGFRVQSLVAGYLGTEGHLKFQTKNDSHKISSSQDKQTSHNVAEAQRILRGESADYGKLVKLGDDLRRERYFGYARRLYEKARGLGGKRRQDTTSPTVLQRQVHCTYRDPDLPAEIRFERAMTLLTRDGDLENETPSAESLTLAGSILKSRWQIGGRRADLEEALTFYQRAAAPGVRHDNGYSAINAAFTLDLLGKLEGRNDEAAAQRRRAMARALREKIVTELLPAIDAPQPDWWRCAILAEAFFGLNKHQRARYWLREGLATAPAPWQIESTSRQFVALADAQGQSLQTTAEDAEESEAILTLRLLFGEGDEAIVGATIGKVGLALSGGGFRASLFHIGVLARMAELDMLRHVEVLSCVSGGSIVGAHYYLEVRNLLQQKADSGDKAISREDYIELIRRIEAHFLDAVQSNPRMRLFAGWWTNIRTLFQPGYSRTDRLGALFERLIYAKSLPDAGPQWLNKLAVAPVGAPPDFNPKVDNLRRNAKAPILLLNATALNTGHVWQFAVNWMGEPPLATAATVDNNEILRRLYYWEAPTQHRQVRLGAAVAASACVPSLFDPLELRNLYPDRIVRLVDGGVHDNQGVASLIEQECNVILVSDASGQMGSEPTPSGEALSVATRSNNVLMARVREGIFRELDLLHRAGSIRGLVYLHLKKGLEDSKSVDWVDCQDPGEPAPDASRLPLTPYRVPRTLQAKLANLRTDLDAFSDMEAFALMFSGYRMASTEFDTTLSHWPLRSATPASWRFRDIEPIALRDPGFEEEHAHLLKVLEVGAGLTFKVFRLRLQASIVASLCAGALFVGLLTAALLLWRTLQLSLEGPCLTSKDPCWQPNYLQTRLFAWSGPADLLSGLEHLVFIVGVMALLFYTGHRLLGERKSATVIASGLFFSTLGWLAAITHLLLFNRLYLSAGRVARKR